FPMPEDVKQFVVVDDRGYIEMKNGRVLQSSLPTEDIWGNMYVDYPFPGEEHSINSYSFPEFKDLKSKAPEVKNYTGWTHMKCDPNLGIVPKKNSLSGISGVIYSLEAYSLAAPVYFGSRLLSKTEDQ
uniref:hypothetical protein n=1 Tax=Caballeronia sp. GAWG1-1 TaxID=2921742 RepID=UPI002027DCE4